MVVVVVVPAVVVDAGGACAASAVELAPASLVGVEAVLDGAAGAIVDVPELLTLTVLTAFFLVLCGVGCCCCVFDWVAVMDCILDGVGGRTAFFACGGDLDVNCNVRRFFEGVSGGVRFSGSLTPLPSSSLLASSSSSSSSSERVRSTISISEW